MTPDQENWLALSLVQGLGPRSLQGLLAAFGTAEALLAAPADEIGNFKGYIRGMAYYYHY